jgi:hypothetical protein
MAQQHLHEPSVVHSEVQNLLACKHTRQPPLCRSARGFTTAGRNIMNAWHACTSNRQHKMHAYHVRTASPAADPTRRHQFRAADRNSSEAGAATPLLACVEGCVWTTRPRRLCGGTNTKEMRRLDARPGAAGSCSQQRRAEPGYRGYGAWGRMHSAPGGIPAHLHETCKCMALNAGPCLLHSWSDGDCVLALRCVSVENSTSTCYSGILGTIALNHLEEAPRLKGGQHCVDKKGGQVPFNDPCLRLQLLWSLNSGAALS